MPVPGLRSRLSVPSVATGGCRWRPPATVSTRCSLRCLIATSRRSLVISTPPTSQSPEPSSYDAWYWRSTQPTSHDRGGIRNDDEECDSLEMRASISETCQKSDRLIELRLRKILTAMTLLGSCRLGGSRDTIRRLRPLLRSARCQSVGAHSAVVDSISSISSVARKP